MCRRQKSDKVACIDTVPIHSGEIFYLHSLLHHTASSFTDLCTIQLEGHIFSSFDEATTDIGLFNNQNEGLLTMKEAAQSFCRLYPLHGR